MGRGHIGAVLIMVWCRLDVVSPWFVKGGLALMVVWQEGVPLGSGVLLFLMLFGIICDYYYLLLFYYYHH